MFTTVIMSSIALGAMAQTIPQNTHNQYYSSSTDITPSNILALQCQRPFKKLDTGVLRYNTDNTLANELHTTQIEIIHNPVSHPASTASPPEDSFTSPPTTSNLPTAITIPAWPFLATSLALLSRFIFSNTILSNNINILNNNSTKTKNIFSIATLLGWGTGTPYTLDRDYFLLAEKLMFARHEDRSTDDWLGFDSFLEWVDLLMENLGVHCGNSVYGYS